MSAWWAKDEKMGNFYAVVVLVAMVAVCLVVTVVGLARWLFRWF